MSIVGIMLTKEKDSKVRVDVTVAVDIIVALVVVVIPAVKEVVVQIVTYKEQGTFE